MFRTNSTWIVLGVLLISASGALPAQAAGKKPAPTPPALGTPTPVRKVLLRAVGTQAFQLPNGSQVDLTADLATLLQTAVTSTPSFSPTDAGETDPCDSHIEIRAAVSTFDLNVAQVGVSFGYTPSGANHTVTNLTGNLDVKIGTISMDFSVWECVGGRCSAVAATRADHLTAGVDLSLTIDFGTVHTGPSLIANTSLGKTLAAIMGKGMSDLASSARLSELSWRATVRESIPEAGTLIFDQGTQSRLAPNQAFVVYAVTPATGVCDVFKAVSYIHTTQVDTISSTAIIDQTLDPRGIKDGDQVMIRAVGSR